MTLLSLESLCETPCSQPSEKNLCISFEHEEGLYGFLVDHVENVVIPGRYGKDKPSNTVRGGGIEHGEGSLKILDLETVMLEFLEKSASIKQASFL